MQAKITRLARGLKWGCLGSSGFLYDWDAIEDSPLNARYPKPVPKVCSACRLEKFMSSIFIFYCPVII